MRTVAQMHELIRRELTKVSQRDPWCWETEVARCEAMTRSMATLAAETERICQRKETGS